MQGWSSWFNFLTDNHNSRATPSHLTISCDTTRWLTTQTLTAFGMSGFVGWQFISLPPAKFIHYTQKGQWNKNGQASNCKNVSVGLDWLSFPKPLGPCLHQHCHPWQQHNPSSHTNKTNYTTYNLVLNWAMVFVVN